MSPTAAASTGSLPRNPRGKMPLFGRVAGYRQPPEHGAGAGAGQHRLSAVSGRSRLSGSGSGTAAPGAEIWVDSAPGGDKEAVMGDCSNIYGYMDEHKKAMIQQWVEGQATNLHSAPAPPSHLTGRDSLAWLQAHSSSSQLASSSCTQQPGPSCDQLETSCEQQQQYRCLTQFKMAESSTSEASDPPDPVVRVEVEVNSVPATSAISEQRQELRTSDKAAAGAREAAAQEGRSPGVTPGPQPRDPSEGEAPGQDPPPPLHSAPAPADTRSVASASSRASSRKSDAATNTGDTDNSNNNNNPAATFHPRHQDPFGGSRRLTLPRRSPAAASREDTELEDSGSIRTLDELYR